MDTQLRTSVPATTRLRVVWAALLGLTAISTLLGLLTAPFDAEEGEFIHALRSGEVASVALGHSQDFYSDSGLNATSYNAWDDIAVVWVNRFGFRREAVLNGLGALDQLTQSTQDSQSTSRLDPAASIARTAQSLGVAAPKVVQPGELPFDHVKWLSVLL